MSAYTSTNQTLLPAKPFAEPLNPYAAPQYPHGYQPMPQAGNSLAGLWRQGKVLVMHKNAPLPDICLKSNEPATKRLRRKMQWHHPAIALTILLGLLVYIIIAIILTKKATIDVPLTDAWYARRQRRLMFAWGAALAGIALMVLGVALVGQPDGDIYGWLMLIGLVISLGALIYGQVACPLVRPSRITDQYVWLKGVHPDFLDRLEVWTYNV